MSDTQQLQDRIARWLRACFGPSPAVTSPEERALRLLEEAVELAQAEGLTRSQVDAIINRTLSRPPGDPPQEAAGVGVCLLAWGACKGVSVYDLIADEMDRVERPETIQRIRRKHAEKVADGTSLRFD